MLFLKVKGFREEENREPPICLLFNLTAQLSSFDETIKGSD